MTNETLTDSQRKECGDAKPQLSCWHNSFGKGRSYNLDRPSGSHETQENTAPSTLGTGLGVGKIEQHLQYNFHVFPHTPSFHQKFVVPH